MWTSRLTHEVYMEDDVWTDSVIFFKVLLITTVTSSHGVRLLQLYPIQ